MSDDDRSSKTEEATPKRLQQARERGQIAQSQDVQVWATLCAGAMALAMLAPAAAERALRAGLRFLERPEQMHVDLAGMRAGLADVLLEMAVILGPTLLLLALFGHRLRPGAGGTDVGDAAAGAGLLQAVAAEGGAAAVLGAGRGRSDQESGEADGGDRGPRRHPAAARSRPGAVGGAVTGGGADPQRRHSRAHRCGSVRP